MVVDHIGIACHNTDELVKLYSGVLKGRIGESKVYEDMGCVSTFINFYNAKLEILEPCNNNSVISSYLDKKGIGLHHISFKVDNIESIYNSINTTGKEFLHEIKEVNEMSKMIKYTFMSPKFSNNILIELFEEKDVSTRGEL
ncbi:VOC family protein [Lutispora sp.]|uniref:VOC family protein n=1 Tax=Lutispora sp. TaxID=2828727 RepID=UPI002B1E93A1|nr:VOC family protein [Lutispora sp.]MEA4962227.1 VOC family protein [Lutispora sp.]